MFKKLYRNLIVFFVVGFTSAAFGQFVAAGTSGVREIRFTLNPGASFAFSLPATQSPVRIEVSFTLANGGTQVPSELMYAVINRDTFSNQLTWIGTNSDGSTLGANSISSTTIARIFGGSPSTTNVALVVSVPSSGTVRVFQSAATTALPGRYVVKIYF